MTSRRRWCALLLVFVPCALAQVRSNPLVREDEEKMRYLTVFIDEAPSVHTPGAGPLEIGTAVTRPRKDGAQEAGEVQGPLDNPSGGYYGAGIITGGISTTVYIVTAQHVVTKIKEARLRVRFYKDEREYPARLVKAGPANSTKPEDDIAVICVEGKIFEKLLPDYRSGRAVYDTDVYILGHPNRHEWEISAKPDAVTDTAGATVVFQSAIVAPGDSGGPLLGNNLRLLVGMVIADQPPHGIAISCFYLEQKMRLWGIPFFYTAGDNSPVWPFK